MAITACFAELQLHCNMAVQGNSKDVQATVNESFVHNMLWQKSTTCNGQNHQHSMTGIKKSIYHVVNQVSKGAQHSRRVPVMVPYLGTRQNPEGQI